VGTFLISSLMDTGASPAFSDVAAGLGSASPFARK
jgi:hypothetical protein